MDLSKKFVLAACTCVAFLACFSACTVDDHDIESAGVFVCRSDDDCLKDSECVKTKESDEEGRCARSEDVKHCADNDGDGFIGVTVDKSHAKYAEYVAECGFSSKNPQDPDDSDPTVYPDAAELCDGKDNSGDGCVDGVCTDESGICEDKTEKCEPITQPCWGAGDVDDYDNSVCSAALIGYKKCVDGVLTYIAPTSSKSTYTGTDCPVSTSDIPNYVDSEDSGEALNDNIDNNCNGVVDESRIDCATELAKLSNQGCSFSGSTNLSIEKSDKYHKNITDYCEENNCKADDCIGMLQCPANHFDYPVCISNSGKTESTVTGSDCLAVFDDI